MQTVQESHNKQLEILRVAIADERKQFAQAQLVRTSFFIWQNYFVQQPSFIVFLKGV